MLGEPIHLQKGAPEGTLHFKGFDELVRHLERTGQDLERIVYPCLKFGAFFWIPDVDSGFGQGDMHPWVIVVAYQATRPTVIACPRTSSRQWERGENGLLIPRGVIDGLDRDGLVLLNFRRPFLADSFRHYPYIGLMPEEWQIRMRTSLAVQVQRASEGSGEP